MTKEKLEKLHQIVSIVGTIGGLFVAAMVVPQYCASFQQEKTSKSFEYFYRYHSGEILNVRVKFHTLLDQLLSTKPSADTLIAKIKERENRLNYDILLEFFDDVYKCSEVGGCDKKTTINLFADKAEEIWFFVKPVVENYRNQDNAHHGRGLECIATKGKNQICKE